MPYKSIKVGFVVMHRNENSGPKPKMYNALGRKPKLKPIMASFKNVY